jgi:ribonuclease HI
VKSGWGFVVFCKGKRVHSEADAFQATTSSRRMEIEAVTVAFGWFNKLHNRHCVSVTDSQSMLRNVENNMVRSEWKVILECTTISSITWIYCPGHACVRGNEEADKLAGQAPIDGVVCLDRGVILKRVIDKFKEAENEDNNSNVYIQRMR